jgi:ankyrin repeat protein
MLQNKLGSGLPSNVTSIHRKLHDNLAINQCYDIQNALFECATLGYDDIMKTLVLCRGLDLTSALIRASGRGHLAAVRLLLDNGAKMSNDK